MARKSRKNVEPVVVSKPQFAYRVAAYMRQSSDGKRKPSDTLETQRNIIENYVATVMEIELVEVYIDNNKSGTTFDRPEFQRMLSDIESGNINCIICKDLTRLGRNAIDSGYYLERYFPLHNVRFIAITDDYDSNNGDGGLMIPLKNIIAETYAIDISNKCKAVQRQHIHDGNFVGRLAPYGYMRSPDNFRQLVIDKEAAKIVQDIFQLFLRGFGYNDIVRSLNDDHILTPSHYKKAQGIIEQECLVGGECWTKRTVKNILTDPVYVGDLAQGRTRKINGKTVDTPRSEWVVVQNTHEPIVSRKIFERVQKLREQNMVQKKETHNAIKPYTTNIFSGKVFCAKCGYPMGRHKQSGHEYYWYRCESQWKYGKGTCVQVSVKESDLKSTIITLLHKQSEMVLGGYVISEKSKPSKLNDFEKELREFNQTLNKSGFMLASLYDNMVNCTITMDEFTKMKADYQHNIDTLSARADEIRRLKRELENEADEKISYADALSKALSDDNLTAETIDTLVEKILVNPDKSFTVEFRFQNIFEEVRHAV